MRRFLRSALIGVLALTISCFAVTGIALRAGATSGRDVLLWAQSVSQILSGIFVPSTSGSGTALTKGLVGPCDIFSSAGTPCVAAHSVTRRLLGSYTGNLFQLTRASDGATQNIGSVSSGLYDASSVRSFCAGTDCYFTEIYDQTGNANHLPQSSTSLAAPWWTSGQNGLPVVLTYGSNSGIYYRNRTGTTNIPTGTASSTTFEVENSYVYSVCCAGYGRMETNYLAPVNGTMFAIGFSSKSSVEFPITDMEGATPAFNLSSVPAVATIESKYTNSNSTMTMKVWNTPSSVGPVSQSGLPWTDPYGSAPTTPIIVQSGISLGEGGDASQAPQAFQEGFITSGATTDAVDVYVEANISSFYGNQNGFYIGPVDTAWTTGCAGATCTPPSTLWCSNVLPNCHTKDPSPMNFGAWGLRKMRAGYTGYAATIRRASDNTTANIGFSASGDFDDAAAQSFCAGTNCFVVTLYNQAVAHQHNDGQHSTYDLNQTTAGNQPKLLFNAGAGFRSEMNFNGSTQFICTLGTAQLPQTSQWSVGVVAERTGNLASASYAMSANGNQMEVGFTSSANTATFISASANAGTATATDSTFNLIVGQVLASTVSLSVNNGTPVTASNSGAAYSQFPICMGASAFYSSGFVASGYFAGNIEEAFMATPDFATAAGTAALTVIYNNEHTYYGGAF